MQAVNCLQSYVHQVLWDCGRIVEENIFFAVTSCHISTRKIVERLSVIYHLLELDECGMLWVHQG